MVKRQKNVAFKQKKVFKLYYLITIRFIDQM